MGKCRNHPDVEAAYMCLKHKHYLCEACLSCSDPELYCKYRQSCAIHFLEKERRLLEKQGKASE